jgi:hypothetical protein
LVDSAVASGEFVGSADQIKASVENFLATQPEFIQFYDNVVTSNETATQAVKSFADALINEDASKAIDDFQSSINKIKDALSDTSSLSSSDLIDLMQQFSSFDWSSYGVTGEKGVGNLTGALKELAKQQYESTIATTGQNEALYKLYVNSILASKTTLSLSDALSKMNTSGKTLDDVKTEIEDIGSISSETISDLLSKYPQLEGVIAQYNAGLASSEDVLNELSKVYETDFDNYKEAVIEKNKYSESFYDSIVDNLPAWVKNLADAYDVDFENFKNLSEAKEGLIKKFLTQESLADSYRLQNQSGISADQAVANYQNSMKSTKSASDLLKLIEGVDNASIDTLDLKGYTPANKTKTKKDPKQKEEFKGSINWAEQSLKTLEDSVSDAQDKLDNTKGYDAQTKAINKLIDAQKLLKSGYEDTADMYEKKYNKSLKGIGTYKNDIESGKVFTLQNFNGNEKLYNKVITAQEYYNNWQDNEKSATDTGYKIANNRQSLVDREIQKQYDNVTKTIDAYKDGISEIQSLAEQFPDGSNRQFAVLSSGIKKASDEVTYLEDQLVKLKGNKSKMDADEYAEQFETISNAIQDARQSANDFLKSMADAFNASIDTTLDDLESAYKSQVDALNEQKDAYADIVDAQKKSLELEKKKKEYEDSITEKTDAIADIQSRIYELSKAANTGDRSAQAEMKKLQDELADKQKDLADTQADHKYDLEMDALDTSLDNNNDIIDTELKGNEKVYNDKIAKLETLRTKTMQLITDASLYTDQEFGAKLSNYANEINNIITSLNTDYGSKVSGISPSALGSISNAQSQVAAGSTTYINDKSTGSVKDSVIASKLRSGTGIKGDSALNKYVYDNYGSYLTYAEMVEVARLLSVKGISSVSDVSGIDNASNREKIRKALIGAGFSSGGYVDASNAIKITGEDGIALVKHGEPILTVEQGKLFKDLVGRLPVLDNLVKMATPNISNITTNNNSSPNVNIYLPANSVIDNSAISNWKQFVPQLTSEVTKAIMNKSRQY